MSGGSLEVVSRSPETTEAIAAALLPFVPETGLIAFRGDLASGKTCFIRGLKNAAACPEPFGSPTFTLVNEYHGARDFFHIDLYRLDPEELNDLGYEELFDPKHGVSLVEWADRVESALPGTRLDIGLEHAGGDARRIRIADRGLLDKGWAAALESAAG